MIPAGPFYSMMVDELTSEKPTKLSCMNNYSIAIFFRGRSEDSRKISVLCKYSTLIYSVNNSQSVIVSIYMKHEENVDTVKGYIYLTAVAIKSDTLIL